MSANIVALLYLAAGVLFILALRGLSSPESSRQGNFYGMLGMAIAVVTTLLNLGENSFTTLGVDHSGRWHRWGDRRLHRAKIPMTAMRELVAAFHSLVGLAAVFVAAGALQRTRSFRNSRRGWTVFGAKPA